MTEINGSNTKTSENISIGRVRTKNNLEITIKGVPGRSKENMKNHRKMEAARSGSNTEKLKKRNDRQRIWYRGHLRKKLVRRLQKSKRESIL